MFKKLFAISMALIALVGMSPSAAADSSQSGEYLISATPGVSLQGNLNGMQIGGVDFEPVAGELPVSVVIADASGLAVPYTICQDNNADGLCGDEAVGEPNVLGCGSEIDISEAGFDASLGITVFVQMVDLAGCNGATSGTVTINYVTPETA